MGGIAIYRHFFKGGKMLVKNIKTGAIFDVTEKYYEEFMKNNQDIEKIESKKEKNVKPFGGE